MHDELKALGIEVLAMSTDSRFTHKIWQEEELSKMVEGGVPFPMLADAGGRIGTVYGVYDEAAGVDIRGFIGKFLDGSHCASCFSFNYLIDVWIHYFSKKSGHTAL